MADAVDRRDSPDGGHSRRVVRYSACIVHGLQLARADVDLIVSAARMHDVGKIGIPDAVLMKSGPLSTDEWALMVTHPEIGARLLAPSRRFGHTVDVVRHHHERWDGQGYPARLAGADIPLGARIVAVADGFDAMTSDRFYRKALPRELAKQILADGRGTQWDGGLVDLFLATVDGG